MLADATVAGEHPFHCDRRGRMRTVSLRDLFDCSLSGPREWRSPIPVCTAALPSACGLACLCTRGPRRRFNDASMTAPFERGLLALYHGGGGPATITGASPVRRPRRESRRSAAPAMEVLMSVLSAGRVSNKRSVARTQIRRCEQPAGSLAPTSASPRAAIVPALK